MTDPQPPQADEAVPAGRPRSTLPPEPPLEPRPLTRGLVAGLVAVVLAVAVGGYAITGTPNYGQMAADYAEMAAIQASAPQGPVTPEQVAQMAKEIQEHLKAQPQDAQGWAMLGRAKLMLGETGPSVDAFRQALAITPTDPRLLTDAAEALGMVAGRSLVGEPTLMLQRALALEPRLPKALALSGAAAFDRGDWPAAIGFWQRLIESSPPDADYVAQVREGIEEARRRMTVAGAASGAVSGAVAAPSATAPAAAAAVAGPVLRGTVALSERLRAQVRPEDVVFVFARPAEGPRMPLAVVKAQVKDLPLNFALDDSMAMSPAARLSGSPRVVVTARISRTGQAGPQAGDLTGESGVVAADAQGVRIEIADVVARP